ncbi:nucleosome assembly protein (nap) protein [Toxoplasma gondii GT1]|uniref:Nucleosome assembly protein (Nap) protein n=3 Tax=Toxoplasma gondii TaxID=5811 RepID=S7UG11_TOXGG|nr:nucleosome assembly protein (nap) protein [Toxoplasma gondii GT1]
MPFKSESRGRRQTNKDGFPREHNCHNERRNPQRSSQRRRLKIRRNEREEAGRKPAHAERQKQGNIRRKRRRENKRRGEKDKRKQDWRTRQRNEGREHRRKKTSGQQKRRTIEKETREGKKREERGDGLSGTIACKRVSYEKAGDTNEERLEDERRFSKQKNCGLVLSRVSFLLCLETVPSARILNSGRGSNAFWETLFLNLKLFFSVETSRLSPSGVSVSRTGGSLPSSLLHRRRGVRVVVSPKKVLLFKPTGKRPFRPWRQRFEGKLLHVFLLAVSLLKVSSSSSSLCRPVRFSGTVLSDFLSSSCRQSRSAFDADAAREKNVLQGETERTLSPHLSTSAHSLFSQNCLLSALAGFQTSSTVSSSSPATAMDASKKSEKDGAPAAPGVSDIELISNRLEAVTIDNKSEEENEILSSLSPEQRRAVEDLQALQAKHDELERAYDRELVALKMKYEKLYAPLYAQRKERLLQKDSANPSAQAGTPAVPAFWMNCLKQNSTLAELVEEHDAPILEHLENISCEYFTPEEQTELERAAGQAASEEPAGTPESFRLVFDFSPNEFFTPNRLVKEYHLTVSSGRHGAELTSTKSTPIAWKEGKDVTKKVVTRKQRNRKTRQTRTVEEVVDNESFFNFFTDHEIPSEEKIETMSDKQIGELQMIVEADYDIGVTIRDKIIPQAVEWFLGEADDDEPFDDDFDDEDDDDDDDMLSDDDEDSDEDEAPRRGAGGRGQPRGKGRHFG